MEVRSLAYRTDLIFLRPRGELIEREEYLVVRSPQEPSFYYGNLLVFRTPPTPGDLARWTEAFRREFEDLPGVAHRTFGWDDPRGGRGAVQPFLEAGYELEVSSVLAARQVRPPARPADWLEVRTIRTDADWEAVLACQLACRPARFEAASYETFKRARLANLREMAEAGLGSWYGAFRGGELVGGLGIYADGDVGRFHEVNTRPEHRRQGVCGTLVHAASKHASEAMGVRRLVIVAEPGSTADRIYRAAGFREVEVQASVCKYPD